VGVGPVGVHVGDAVNVSVGGPGVKVSDGVGVEVEVGVPVSEGVTVGVSLGVKVGGMVGVHVKVGVKVGKSGASVGKSATSHVGGGDTISAIMTVNDPSARMKKMMLKRLKIALRFTGLPFNDLLTAE
jgi:hypothetical protein